VPRPRPGGRLAALLQRGRGERPARRGSRAGDPSGRHAIYNLGTGHGYTVKEVVDAARRVTGREIPAREEARRPGDPAALVAASDRIRDELGWEPEKGLEEMIADALAWHQAHPDGYGD
jgi:UDP-glucose 4-epimerase